MGKEKSGLMGSFLHELFRFGVYKWNQGRVTRQGTGGVLGAAFLFAAWRLWSFLVTQPGVARYGYPCLVLIVGLWFSYRMVNFPKFADFLIAVEAEMNKVSWPTRLELVRSSIVVIVVIVGLASILFSYDVFWQFIFSERVLGIIKG